MVLPNPHPPQRQALEHSLVVPLHELRRSDVAVAGGKAANLGELLSAGFAVPAGFYVTTVAYRAAALEAGLAGLLEQAQSPREMAAAAQAGLIGQPLAEELSLQVREAYRALADDDGPALVAVRSSATAEDLPEASFAGQQDTFLNVRGEEVLLQAVRKCWASLWTERAIAYRAANGIDQRAVELAVVVQRMVAARSAGVLFTANPLSGRRTELVVDAATGLGERVVSGAVTPDHFVIDRAGPKVVSRQPGGSEPVCLSDKQVLELAELGLAVEEHYGSPQDLEWGFAPDGKLWLLQARPITTLFPLPPDEPSEPGKPRVYFSFSVAQGVLQPFTPMGFDALRRLQMAALRALGLSAGPGHSALPCHYVGGRVFFDITAVVRNRLGRRILAGLLSAMEPQTGAALRDLLVDPRFREPSAGLGAGTLLALLGTTIRARLIPQVVEAWRRPRAAQQRLAHLRSTLASEPRGEPSTPLEALERAEALLLVAPSRVGRAFPTFIAGAAAFVLTRRLAGAAGAADETLIMTRSLPNNPTTEMDLELWAASMRLRRDQDSRALLLSNDASELAAGFRAGTLPPAFQTELNEFLRRYGFRGVAEIDLGVPRWRDDPTQLVGALANYLRLEDPALAPDRQFQLGAVEAGQAIGRMVERARVSGPFGSIRAALLAFFADRARALFGAREVPKFLIVQVIGRARELIAQAGAVLVASDRLEQANDIFLLDLTEARRAAAGTDLRQLVAERRAQQVREARRRLLPRILLSDGTALYGGSVGTTDKAGLHGTPASPGVFTGRARVIMQPAGAYLEPGEILVAPSTDPGWTPLFLTAGALVMEMGGMMSHGSVVAREYGIPAVVGVLGATSAIETGQRITVDGGRGLVSLVDEMTSPEC